MFLLPKPEMSFLLICFYTDPKKKIRTILEEIVHVTLITHICLCVYIYIYISYIYAYIHIYGKHQVVYDLSILNLNPFSLLIFSFFFLCVCVI